MGLKIRNLQTNSFAEAVGLTAYLKGKVIINEVSVDGKAFNFSPTEVVHVEGFRKLGYFSRLIKF